MANGITFLGRSLKGTNQAFINKVTSAAMAAGATKIYVYSARRTPSTNTGVANSNHLYGHAMDAKAFVPGTGWVPLGTLLRTSAAPYGLRSGDQPGFYKNAPDPNHVDDGFNVNGNKPLPSNYKVDQATPQPEPDAALDTGTQDQTTPDQTVVPPHPLVDVQTPPLGGYALTQAALPGTVDPQAVSIPPKSPVVSTWKLLSEQADASPETLRYAQLASGLNG